MNTNERVTLAEAWEGFARGRVHVFRDGRPFYVFDNARGFTFTLPAGTYSLHGDAVLLRKMKPRKGATVGAPRLPLPPRVSLVWCDNPHKCSIDLRTGRIFADRSLAELPQFALVYILFHEIGHYFYQDEERCDEFAAREMHRRGYNPSQIHLAAQFTLSHHSEHRKRKNYATARALSTPLQ